MRTLQFTIFATQKEGFPVIQEVTRLVSQSVMAYIQGTCTCQIHGSIMIRPIGREARFGQHFRRYR